MKLKASLHQLPEWQPIAELQEGNFIPIRSGDDQKPFQLARLVKYNSDSGWAELDIYQLKPGTKRIYQATGIVTRVDDLSQHWLQHKAIVRRFAGPTWNCVYLKSCGDLLAREMGPSVAMASRDGSGIHVYKVLAGELRRGLVLEHKGDGQFVETQKQIDLVPEGIISWDVPLHGDLSFGAADLMNLMRKFERWNDPVRAFDKQAH